MLGAEGESEGKAVSAPKKRPAPDAAAKAKSDAVKVRHPVDCRHTLSVAVLIGVAETEGV
jgi:hypothetical protein